MKLLTLVLMAGVALSSATVTCADPGMPHHTKIPDHLMMKAGKMVMMHGFDNVPVSEDVILSNGTRVQSDGTVTPVIGDRTKLKEGEVITREGRIIKVAEAAITREIKRSLLYHLSLNFHVKTQDGVVTLSGEASSAAEKELNTKLATAVIGVKRVVNNMVVPVSVAGNE